MKNWTSKNSASRCVCVDSRLAMDAWCVHNTTHKRWYIQTTSLFINNLMGFLLRHWNCSVLCAFFLLSSLPHTVGSQWIYMKFWCFFMHRNCKNHSKFIATTTNFAERIFFSFFFIEKMVLLTSDMLIENFLRCRQCKFQMMFSLSMFFSLWFRFESVTSVTHSNKSLTYSFQSNHKKCNEKPIYLFRLVGAQHTYFLSLFFVVRIFVRRLLVCQR